MEVSFKPSFIKDFQELPSDIKKEVKEICAKDFPKLNKLRDFTRYHTKPLTGFKKYYRIKVGEYRIGFKAEKEGLVFMRVKHRKDIYRYFP